MSALPSLRARALPDGLRRAGAVRPDLRLVERPRHAARWLAVLALFAAAGVFGVVSLHALAAEKAFTARALEVEVNRLALRHHELTAEVAALESPERVRRLATAQLGMVPAQQPAFLVLDPA
ncbi:MAG: septum formation initiator family protein, partial [Actinomycetota bacterium]|nr:septum formation initiator family protein [Actinomycetota bacterium]